MGILGNLGLDDPRVLAIDVSRDALETARIKAPHPSVEYRQMDFLKDEQFYNRFKLIFFNAIWHHFPDTREALRRAEAALVPGGSAIVFNGFYPEDPYLRSAALLVQFMYKKIEERGGLPFGKPLISTIRAQVEECCPQLIYRGDFLAGDLSVLQNDKMTVLQKIGNIIAMILNTRMVVFQKLEEAI